MKAETLALLCRIAGGVAPASLARGVTVTPKKPSVTPVTPIGKGKGKGECVSVETLNRVGPDVAAIDERAGIASVSVPACYLAARARLNCQKPFKLSELDWLLALDAGGQFLDEWGAAAATTLWSAADLFDLPQAGRRGGLVWLLKGERVNALDKYLAWLVDGRTIKRVE